MSLEMAQKVIVPQKKNYVPQFLKQRDINSYNVLKKKNKQSKSKYNIFLHQGAIIVSNNRWYFANRAER
jgi:hypothetical protein